MRRAGLFILLLVSLTIIVLPYLGYTVISLAQPIKEGGGELVINAPTSAVLTYQKKAPNLDPNLIQRSINFINMPRNEPQPLISDQPVKGPDLSTETIPIKLEPDRNSSAELKKRMIIIYQSQKTH